MKTCKGCKILKQLTEFYRHSGTSDGLRGKCKACMRVDTEAWFKSHPEKTTEYNARPAAKARRARYSKSERGKASHARSRKRNPARIYAYAVVQRAIKDGTLTRKGICDVCKTSGQTEFHHSHGYDKANRLNVIETCKPCHETSHHTEAA